jgi:hypothetical protein
MNFSSGKTIKIILAPMKCSAGWSLYQSGRSTRSVRTFLSMAARYGFIVPRPAGFMYALTSGLHDFYVPGRIGPGQGSSQMTNSLVPHAAS